MRKLSFIFKKKFVLTSTIHNQSTSYGQSTGSAAPPSDIKAQIGAAKALEGFFYETSGFLPMADHVWTRSDLEALAKQTHFTGQNGQSLEIPEDVRNAAKLVLADQALYDCINNNGNNGLEVAELNAFASTNEAMDRLFGI